MSSSDYSPGVSGPLNPEEQARPSEPAQSTPLQPASPAAGSPLMPPTPFASASPGALANEPTISGLLLWPPPSGPLPQAPQASGPQSWPLPSGPMPQMPGVAQTWPSSGPLPSTTGPQTWPPPSGPVSQQAPGMPSWPMSSGPLPQATGPQMWPLPASGPVTSPTGAGSEATTGTRWLVAFALVGLALALVGGILFVLTPAASASVHADTLSTTSGLAALCAGALLLIVPFVLPPLQKRLGRRPEPAGASSALLALASVPIAPGGEAGPQPIQSYTAPVIASPSLGLQPLNVGDQPTAPAAPLPQMSALAPLPTPSGPIFAPMPPSGPFPPLPTPVRPPSGPYPQMTSGPLPQPPGPAFVPPPPGLFPWEGEPSASPIPAAPAPQMAEPPSLPPSVPPAQRRRIKPQWLALLVVVGLLVATGGLVYGLLAPKPVTSTVPYKTDGPSGIGELVLQCSTNAQAGTQGCTGYLELEDGPTLYTFNGNDFSPPITDVFTFSPGEQLKLVYRADQTHHITKDLGDGSVIDGDFYTLVQITSFDSSGQQNQQYTTAEYPPKPPQSVATGGLIILIAGLALMALAGVLLVVSLIIGRRRKQVVLASASLVLPTGAPPELPPLPDPPQMA